MTPMHAIAKPRVCTEKNYNCAIGHHCANYNRIFFGFLVRGHQFFGPLDPIPNTKRSYII